MGEELKPCPFCGKKGKLVNDNNPPCSDWWVACYACELNPITDEHKKPEDAIKAWNTRAEDTQALEAENKRLKEKINSTDMLLRGVLLGRSSPLAPHHVSWIKERVGYTTETELLEKDGVNDEV